MLFKILFLLQFIFLVPFFLQANVGLSDPSHPKSSRINWNLTDSLKEAFEKGGVLSEYIQFRRAEVLLENKKPEQARSILDQIPGGSDFDLWKKVLEASVALQLNQALKVLSILEKLPSPPEITFSPQETFYRKHYQEALLLQKEAMRLLGKSTREIEAQLWAYFPDLENSTVSLTPSVPVTLNEKVERLHVLHEKKIFDPILTFLPSINELSAGKLDIKKKCQALFEWANAMRGLKKSGEALNGYSAVDQYGCGGEILNRSLFWKGKFLVNQKRFPEAIATYKHSIKKFPHHRYTDDAWHALWNIYKQLGQDSEARKAYFALMSLPEGDVKAKIIWKEAYADYKKGHYRKAIDHLERILAMGNGLKDESYPQALYWKARCLESLQKSPKMSAESKSLYRQLVSQFPFSFYGVLASNRLQIPPSSVSFSGKKTVPSYSGVGQSLLDIVDAFNGMGEKQKAKEVLDYLAQKAGESQNRQLMALKWMENGNYYQSLMMAHEYFETDPSSASFDQSDPLLAALFPLAYRDETSQASRVSGLPKGVIEGIMREESLFQPEVRSHAGAKGLMQLMPATAAMQAKINGAAGFSLHKLSDPQTNILLGATFFDKMVADFKGHIPLAIMAYNAGPGNVRKWLRTQGHLPLDEFVEEIPFSETRGYIKRVLRSVQVYGSLYNEPKLSRPFFSMKLPK